MSNDATLDFGVNRDTFQDRYFEKRPFFKKACFDSSRYDWEVIDRALALQDPGREMLKVLKSGRVAPEDYIEEFIDIGVRRRRILKDRLYKHLSEGATIVLNRIELASPSMHELCMQVGRLAGAQTTANAYACLGGGPATNVHWDTHDVFILQLTGTKHWRVYEPTFPLPISSQVSNDRKEDVPEQPFLALSLEAGDALYVPRGWWHRVTPIDNHETIHLTVAVHTPLILDYVVWACSNVLPNFLEMRHSLIGTAGDAERIRDAMRLVARTLQDDASIVAFSDRCKQRERVVTPFQIGRLLKNRGRLSTADRLRLNSRSANEAAQAFYVNGRRVSCDGSVRKVVGALASGPEMSVGVLQERLQDIPSPVLDALLKNLARADIIEILYSS